MEPVRKSLKPNNNVGEFFTRLLLSCPTPQHHLVSQCSDGWLILIRPDTPTMRYNILY